MPALVYRITEVLSAIVIELPLGTNLGLFYILWTLTQRSVAAKPWGADPGLGSYRLGAGRGAAGVGGVRPRRLGYFPADRRPAGGGAAGRGRWHAQHIGGYRVVAVDTTGFFRPRLKELCHQTLSYRRRAKHCQPFPLG